MKKDIFLKVVCSLPMLLICLYFLPFLGICLLIVRYIISHNNRKLPYILLFVGILLMIPKLFNIVLDVVHYDIANIPYFNDILTNKFYDKDCLNYSKFLITIGFLILIVKHLIKMILGKLGTRVSNYISEQEKKEQEIFQKNDLIMKEKREKLKNTHVVYCSYCGAENMLSEQMGTCKYCRRTIEYKEGK